jgi:hypothetical protein
VTMKRPIIMNSGSTPARNRRAVETFANTP